MSEDKGLHTADTTIVVRNTEGTERRWKRTALVCDGEHIFETSGEHDGFGLCVTDSGLKLNGEVIAPGNRTDAVTVDSDGLSFGDIPVANKANCIRITKENYRLLRLGKPVAGYSRYRPENVYYITEDTASRVPIPFDKELVAGHEDIIWNSFTGELADNPLTDKTQLSVKTPTMAMRYFNPKIKQGDKLELEYFVDTKDYDSVYKGIIEDTFTTIISGPNGELARKTTYAGQFKISVNVGSTVGRSWFSIRCIDKAGRGSVEYFFDYDIVPATAPNIKELDATEMANFGLTIGNNVGYEAAYKNRRNFVAMCHTLKGQEYDGVKLYNANSNIDLDNLEDPNNSVIEFDNRWNVGTGNNYVPAGNTYYLLKYDADEQALYGYDSSNDEWVELQPSGANASEFGNSLLSLCDGSKITANKSFVLADDNTVTVGNSVTIANTTKQTPSVLDWIRWDGAGIFRDETTGKIIVFWNDVDADCEVMSSSESNSARMLRVRSLNYIATQIYSNKWSVAFPAGSGYYYCAWYNGRGGTERYGDYDLPMPSNFVIDLNACVLKNVNNTGIRGRSYLLFLTLTENVTVKNGTLRGLYSVENIKRAYLEQCMLSGGGTWTNSHGLVALDVSTGCLLENLVIDGSHGYELYAQAWGNGNTDIRTGYSKANFEFGTDDSSIAEHLYRIGTDNTQRYNVIVEAEGGGSLVTSLFPDYDANKNQQVCLLTSDKVPCENLTLLGKFNTTDTYNNAHHFSLPCDEIFILSMAKMRYGGAYPYYFVNFYNGNTFIKSVKTEYAVSIKVPANATHLSVTVYAYCEVANQGLPSQSISLPLRDGAVKYVSDWVPNPNDSNTRKRLRYSVEHPVKNAVIRNCVIKNTRTVTLGDLGINGLVENCVFDNICSTQKRFSLTPMLVDMEETRVFCNIVCFRNCKVKTKATSSAFQAMQSVVNCPTARGMQVEHCENIGLNISGQNCCIADNTMTKFVIKNWGCFDLNCRNIVKRIAVAGTAQSLWTMRYADGNSDITRVMSCYEQVNKELSFEDSLSRYFSTNNQVTGSSICALVGRRYKIVNDNGATVEIHDSYNED